MPAMAAPQIIAIYGVVMIVAAVLAGYVAVSKNRDYSFWMAWAFLVPPSLLILVFLPRRGAPPPPRPTLDEEDATMR